MEARLVARVALRHPPILPPHRFPQRRIVRAKDERSSSRRTRSRGAHGTFTPVADVERAKEFYAGKLGFNVDTDAQLSDDFRVVQLTPPGSGCSIILMSQGAQMEPGTLKGPQLVVSDLRTARAELAGRGVGVSEVQVIDGGPPMAAEPDDQLDYRGFVFFEDPDGNGWAIQQLSQSLADRTAALAAADGPRGAPDPA